MFQVNPRALLKSKDLQALRPSVGDLIPLPRDLYLVPVTQPDPSASDYFDPIDVSAAGPAYVKHWVESNVLIPQNSLVLCLDVIERPEDDFHPFTIKVLWGERIFYVSLAHLY